MKISLFFKKKKVEKVKSHYPNAYKYICLINHFPSLLLTKEVIKDIASISYERWKELEQKRVEQLDNYSSLCAQYPNGVESFKKLAIHKCHSKDYSEVIFHNNEVRDDNKYLWHYMNIINKCRGDLISASLMGESDIINLEHLFCSAQRLILVQDQQGKICDSCNCSHILSCDILMKNNYGDRYFSKIEIPWFVGQDYIISELEKVDFNGDFKAESKPLVIFVREIDTSIIDNIFTLHGFNVDYFFIDQITNESFINREEVFVIANSLTELDASRLFCYLFEFDSYRASASLITLFKSADETLININNLPTDSPNDDNTYKNDYQITPMEEDGITSYFIYNKPLNPIRKIILSYYEAFDVDYWAKVKSREFRMTPDEVKLMWKNKREDAARENIQLRINLSKFFKNKYYDHNESMDIFMMYQNERKIKPYRFNWTIYDTRARIYLTIDCLEYRDSEFVLYNFVRSDSLLKKNPSFFRMDPYLITNSFDKSNLIKRSYKRGNGPLKEVGDNKYSKFEIEQSIIKTILKENYGIVLSHMYIVVIHPSYKRPVAFETNFLENSAQSFLEDQRKINKDTMIKAWQEYTKMENGQKGITLINELECADMENNEPFELF